MTNQSNDFDNIYQLLKDLQSTINDNTKQLATNDQLIINFITTQSKIMYRQIESLFSIYSLFNFRYPLPPMRGWPISPDFGQLLIAHILKYKPNMIFECGSGISTILCGYALDKIGKGKIISLDHEEIFSKKTIDDLSLHQLQSEINVIYAPLCDVQINQTNWKWYDLNKVKSFPLIDMLIVDGPPSTLQKHARYPALHLLRKHFSEDITIFIDDAGRKEEQEFINLWLNEFPEFKFETIETEKGVVILKKK